jgi:trk system potassium uptake protein TrkA
VSVTRTLLALGHELAVVEQEQARYERPRGGVPAPRDPWRRDGDLRAGAGGLGRPPDIVVAVTGDDEDNIVICQLAQEMYGVPKVIARVNDPRNTPHFDLLNISPTVSATSMVLALVEHEVPQHELVHLLELRKENLEIVEVEIKNGSAAAGRRSRTCTCRERLA